MCIKGPENWWIIKSITISRVVNQSTTLFGSCGLIYNELGVIDSVIHQLPAVKKTSFW